MGYIVSFVFLGFSLNRSFMQAWSSPRDQSEQMIINLESADVSDYNKLESVRNLSSYHNLSSEALGRLVDLLLRGPGADDSVQRKLWNLILALIKTNLVSKKTKIDEWLAHVGHEQDLSPEMLIMVNRVLRPLSTYLESTNFWELSLSPENVRFASELCVVLRKYEDSILNGIARKVRFGRPQELPRELSLYNLSELIFMRFQHEPSEFNLPRDMVHDVSEMVISDKLSRSIRSMALLVLNFVLKTQSETLLQPLSQALEKLIVEKDLLEVPLEAALFDYIRSSKPTSSQKYELIRLLLSHYASPRRDSKYRSLVARLMVDFLKKDLTGLTSEQRIDVLAWSFDVVETYCFWVSENLEGTEKHFDIFSILESWSSSFRDLSRHLDSENRRIKMKSILSHMDAVLSIIRLHSNESTVEYVSPPRQVLLDLIKEERCQKNLKTLSR